MEKFYDILLQVNGFPDLVSSLRDYTAAELMKDDNKCQCDSEVCKGKRQNAYRRVVLRSTPPILTFSCQRFDIDRSSWERVKVTSKFAFPLVLDMSEFVEGAHGVAQPKLEKEEEERYINELKSSMLWFDDAAEIARSMAEKLLMEYGEGFDLERDINKGEWVSIRNSLLEPMHKRGENGINFCNRSLDQTYQLFAIIMHRGTAYFGHYFAYIRDCLDEGNWTCGSSVVNKKTMGKSVQVDTVLYIENGSEMI